MASGARLQARHRPTGAGQSGWSLTSGLCDKSYDYVIAVEGSGVRYIPQDSDPAPSVSGNVSPGGAVNLDIRKGIARVAATGKLNTQAGAGSWRLGVLCSGRWTAQKSGRVEDARR